MPDASLVMQYVANGVAYGAILALAAIGLSLVYGLLNLSNFAHGDMLTMGAFAVLFFGRDALGDLPLFALVVPVGVAGFLALDAWRWRRLEPLERWTLGAFAGALAAGGLAVRAFGGVGNGAGDLVLVVATLAGVAAVCIALVTIELLIWRPLRRQRATSLALILVSIGLALVIRNALQIAFTGENQAFDRPIETADRVLGVLLTDAQQITLLVAVALIALVHVFLSRTRAGKAMRALADNPDLARASGIDVDRIVIYVWVLSGALVTVAGVLLSLVQNNTMNVNMGFTILIALFASVIVGGIGSAYGAMLGGLLVGVMMKTSPLWIGSEYELAAAFIALIVVLVVRPQGILGARA